MDPAKLVLLWFHLRMAIDPRLTAAQIEALRRKALEQHTRDRQARLNAAIERIRTEDVELLDRLAR
jgi:hypothetical protein